MKLICASVLALSLLAPSACSAQNSYRFSQNSDGNWSRSDQTTDEDLADAIVHCDRNNTNIEITWYSESGDWVAYDKYRPSSTPYFKREIKFAQFPIVVLIRKDLPKSREVVEFVNATGEYEQLKDQLELPSVVTFSDQDSFPFKLPACAAKEFVEQIRH